MNIGSAAAPNSSEGPIEVVKKAQDTEKQRGEAAVRLIESIAPPAQPVAETPPPGSTISVRA